MSAQDNTAARLKAIVQVLAEEPGTPVKGSDVLAAAVARMPLSAWESEVLSGGVARGVKRLSAATATLVKEGLILKGRTQSYKKAIVSLKEGETIDLYSSI